jgi:CelD/BcsL family acetyltransferase involved in cellulose biosynthesis
LTLGGPAEDAWDALATAAGNIFATRGWQECWWRHFGGGVPTVVTDDAESPSAIVGVRRTGRLLRRVRLIGHGYADVLGVIAADRADPRGVELLHEALDAGPWDVFVAHDVPADNGWCAALGGTELRRVASPLVTLETSDWDDFLRGKSKNFREQLRRRERKLAADHDVVFRMATAATLDDDFATLFDLHRRRWGDDALFAAPDSRRFHEDIGHTALERSWLRLWILELDGQPVASLLGYRFAGADYFVQGGRDPDYEQLSVGSLLLFHTVRRAVEDGMAEYRLLRGNESYKWKLATDDRPVHTFAVANSAIGRASVELARRRQ